MCNQGDPPEVVGIRVVFGLPLFLLAFPQAVVA